jgi:hypothetical protein
VSGGADASLPEVWRGPAGGNRGAAGDGPGPSRRGAGGAGCDPTPLGDGRTLPEMPPMWHDSRDDSTSKPPIISSSGNGPAGAAVR